MKIAVLVSGGGTNLQAIIDSLSAGKITNTTLELVVSNKPEPMRLSVRRKTVFRVNV